MGVPVATATAELAERARSQSGRRARQDPGAAVRRALRLRAPAQCRAVLLRRRVLRGADVAVLAEEPQHQVGPLPGLEWQRGMSVPALVEHGHPGPKLHGLGARAIRSGGE